MFSSLIQSDAGPESPAKAIPSIERERHRFWQTCLPALSSNL
jgi:hypothetical protein